MKSGVNSVGSPSIQSSLVSQGFLYKIAGATNPSYRSWKKSALQCGEDQRSRAGPVGAAVTAGAGTAAGLRIAMNAPPMPKVAGGAGDGKGMGRVRSNALGVTGQS